MHRLTAFWLTSLSFSVLRLGPFLLAMLLLGVPLGAAGSEFVVDSTADEIDANPGDGVCASASGACTLRAAIMETNAYPGPDAITLPEGVYTLAIPGAGEDLGATGDLDVLDDLTITGDGSDLTIIDGAGIDRVLEAKSASTTTPAFVLSVEGIGITGGSVAAYRGGGVSVEGTRLELSNARVYDNVGTGGGGISLWRAEVLLNDSTVAGNSALNDGGGVYLAEESSLRIAGTVVKDNTALSGGGIHFDGWGGQLEVVDSAITGNSALYGGGYSTSNAPGLAQFTNTTISENTATFLGGGAAIWENADFRNCTVTRNTAQSGGGFYAGDAIPTVRASIVAGNSASSAGPDCTVDDAEGGRHALISSGFNLIGDSADCLFFPAQGDMVGTPSAPLDPLLGPFKDNGGFTPTHALRSGSPAIDAIPLADCTWDDDGDPGTPEVPLTEDQRGITRPQGAACDIGAFERVPPPPGPTCGIGPELVLLTPLLMLAHRRRQRRDRR